MMTASCESTILDLFNFLNFIHYLDLISKIEPYLKYQTLSSSVYKIDKFLFLFYFFFFELLNFSSIMYLKYVL